jgi:hypothetical protein
VIRIPVNTALVELITSEIKDILKPLKICEKVLLNYNAERIQNPESRVAVVFHRFRGRKNGTPGTLLEQKS